MTRRFYFLIASLPHLAWEEAPRLNVGSFLQLCRDTVPARFCRWLESAELFQDRPRPAPVPLLQRWYDREHALRNELARRRALRLEVEENRDLREAPFDETAVRLAERVMNMESPWAAEEALDRARWAFLDELEVFHYFDFERLLVYGLKLRLWERRRTFDKEKGRDRFQAFLEEARQRSLEVARAEKEGEP
jgi:Protein of unknown function (DUF2764)